MNARQRLAIVGLLMGAGGVALAADPASCAKVADNTERLACLRRGRGRPHQEAPAPVARRLAVFGPLGSGCRGQEGLLPDPPVQAHLPAAGPLEQLAQHPPTSPNPLNVVTTPNNVDPAEAKYQISFKTKLWEGLLGRHGDLWMATPSSPTGRLYNKASRRPFARPTTKPGPMAVFRTNLDAGAGFKVKMMSLGLNHQSNGRSQPLSRSWNRIVGQIGIERGDFALVVRPWLRLPEKDHRDDNPDITSYMGQWRHPGHVGRRASTVLA